MALWGESMEIEELKLYLKADDTEDDELILALQKSAEEYLKNAGVSQAYTKELYKLAIKLLVAHWYENRKAESDKSKNQISFGLNTIITQLKYTQETNL